jgi:hypothetical protein
MGEGEEDEVAMLPIIKLSQAWLEELGWSHAEAADVFDMDLAAADPAGADDRCPQCTRHPAEFRVSVFVPDPATATPEKVSGRAYVMCLCGKKYWYGAVHAVGMQPVGSAEVRAARTTTEIQPGTAPLQLQGQPPVPAVPPEPMPPGRGFISQPLSYYRWYMPDASMYFQPSRLILPQPSTSGGADNAKPEPDDKR